MEEVTSAAAVSGGRPRMSGCVQALSRMWLRIALACWLSTTSTLAELCIYRRGVYDTFTDSYQKMITTTNCPWGCCYRHGEPCCTAPTSLVVGCVLGGVLILALVIVAVCCCCVCRRRAARRNAASGATSGTRSSTSASGSHGTSIMLDSRGGATQMGHPGPVVYHSDSSRAVDFPLPSSYEPPPSYEEVMRGETNAAFKPDNR